MVDWEEHKVGDDKSKQQLAIRSYCRHLISLAGSYQPIDNNGEPDGDAQAFSYSGFLLIIRGLCCLVTAGHIIRDLDEALNDKSIKLTNSEIIDCWGLEARHKEPFFFDYEKAARAKLYDKNLGLDFALIALSTYYQRHLESNNVVPISEENWIHQDNIKFDEFFVLGLPTERMTNVESQGREWLLPSPTIIPVTKLDQAPAGFETDYRRFVGKIFDNVTLKDMKGMSGGPIIGIGKSKDGRRRYWIVAIQSAWIPSKRIVFGCPVKIFAGIVDEELQQLES